MNAVARRIIDRRLEVGYSTQQEAYAAAGIGSTTWGLMEAKGQLPKSRSVRQKVARALEWPPYAIDNLAAGRDPEDSSSLTNPPVATRQDLAAKVDELGEEVERSHQELSERLDSIAEMVATLLQSREGAGKAQ